MVEVGLPIPCFGGALPDQNSPWYAETGALPELTLVCWKRSSASTHPGVLEEELFHQPVVAALDRSENRQLAFLRVRPVLRTGGQLSNRDLSFQVSHF